MEAALIQLLSSMPLVLVLWVIMERQTKAHSESIAWHRKQLEDQMERMNKHLSWYQQLYELQTGIALEAHPHEKSLHR